MPHGIGILAALAAIAGSAVRAEPPVTLRLGTGTAGGGFQAYADTLAGALRRADPALAITPVPTKGSTENVPLLEQGELDLALATGDVAHAALARPGSRVRALTVAYASPAMFAVRADAPYRRIEDLKGTSVVFGARGSGLVLLVREVLAGVGLDPDRDVRPILLDRAEQGPEMVLSGEASAMWGAGTAWPPFQRIARGPHGARFLAPSPDAVRRITARDSVLRPMTVEAGSYPGQDAPIATLGTWTVVLVRADLPDEVVTRVARALRNAAPELARDAQLRETTLANTVASLPASDLHPAVRHFLEGEGRRRSGQR